jgi:DNA-binding response OmpR family regulator
MPCLLLVDDDDNLRTTIADALEDNGFDVVQASGGEAAFLAASNAHFDVILSDIDMQHGTGFWLLQKLRSSSNATPFVFMSGNILHSREALVQLGANDFLQKPFTVKALLSRLGAVVNSAKVNQAVG